MLRLARITVGKVIDTPLPSEELLKDLEELAARMRRVQKILNRILRSHSIRLVVNPEKIGH